MGKLQDMGITAGEVCIMCAHVGVIMCMSWHGRAVLGHVQVLGVYGLVLGVLGTVAYIRDMV